MQKVPKSESPPLHTIRRSACPDSIFRTQGNAITSPHFRTHVFDLFSCSTCLTCLLVSFSPAVQSMYLNHLPLVSQIIPINSNVGELSFTVVFRFSHLRLHYLAAFKQPNVSSAANPIHPMHYVQTRRAVHCCPVRCQ